MYAEQFLVGEDGGIPDDDKLFVFNGRVGVIQVDRDRHGDHPQRLYDPGWGDLEGTVIAARCRAVRRDDGSVATVVTPSGGFTWTLPRDANLGGLDASARRDEGMGITRDGRII